MELKPLMKALKQYEYHHTCLAAVQHDPQYTDLIPEWKKRVAQSEEALRKVMWSYVLTDGRIREHLRAINEQLNMCCGSVADKNKAQVAMEDLVATLTGGVPSKN